MLFTDAVVVAVIVFNNDVVAFDSFAFFSLVRLRAQTHTYFVEFTHSHTWLTVSLE